MTVVTLPSSPEQELQALLLDDAIIDTARPWTLEGRVACEMDAAEPSGEIGRSAILLDFVPRDRIDSGGSSRAPREPQEAA